MTKNLVQKVEKEIEAAKDMDSLIGDIKTIAFKGEGKAEDCSWSSCHCATYKGPAPKKIDDGCYWSSCHCATYKS